MAFTGFLLDFTGFYLVLLHISELCLILLNLVGFIWFLLADTGFYRVLLGFYWLILGINDL